MILIGLPWSHGWFTGKQIKKKTCSVLQLAYLVSVNKTLRFYLLSVSLTGQKYIILTSAFSQFSVPYQLGMATSNWFIENWIERPSIG